MTQVLATEATLSTLKVEIKALTVSGKQMTLAVFRQLPVSEALDGRWKLRQGVAYWGTVRYPIKDQGVEWAVIEQSGILYRACLQSFFEDMYDRWNDRQVPLDLRGAFDAAKMLQSHRHSTTYLQQGHQASVFRELYREWKKLKERGLFLGAGTEKFMEVYARYEKSHETSMCALHQLPQLFIAV